MRGVGAAVECPTCGFECAETFDFCPQCGTMVQRACSECGFRMPAGFNFCPKCGAPGETQGVAEPEAPTGLSRAVQRLIPKELAERLQASGGQVAGERRVVTILFCDVKGSTAMAEGLDPEDVMEVMDGAFDVLIEPVARYEGTVARLMGDAVLAFFGAPLAHEDDPERACRAALEIVEGAQAYAERLERERAIKGFSVRVGINTGLVVMGEVGSDLRVEYTAMGDAVNLAARVESVAEPGSIVITEHTQRLIASLFETEALGEMEVKGREEPVFLHRLLAPHPTSRKAGGVAQLDSPLVGRQAEFSACDEALERLRAGVGGILTITGEAGIGKSRLVAELRKRVDPSLGWVEGRCLSYGTSIAYHLWLDVLRDLLGVTAEVAPEAVRQALQQEVAALCPGDMGSVYPYLAQLMSLPARSEAETRLQELTGEQLKRGARQAMEKLLACESARRPLVLVGEDLHWADASSLELLEDLLPLVDRTSLLLICLFRPQTEHRSWHIWETAARQYPHRHIDLRLRPLSTRAGGTLLANLLGGEELVPAPARQLPQSVRERILGSAEGNPFYLEEIIRSLIDEGAVERDETSGRWAPTGKSMDIRVPPTVQGVLTARIDRLPEGPRRVVQMASVIGRIFSIKLLAAIMDEQAGDEVARELEEHLLTLQREEMIRERARLPEPEYIFKHELTREAAYAGMLKTERRAYHQRVAEALEQLFPDRIEEQAGLLARHWLRAGENRKAVSYLLAAGDQARTLYAHPEAEWFYSQAIKVLQEQGQEETAARTFMKLGLVHTAAFEPAKAQAAYDKAFAMWEPLRASGYLTEQPAPPAALRLALEEPLTVDPGMTDDDISIFVAAQLFEGLVEVGPDNNVLPAVAARWEVVDEGMRYVFHLREGLQWSDGRPITAADFEYAWKRNLEPATRSPASHLLYVIENARAFGEGEIEDPREVGVHALDPLSLEVRLDAPTAYLPFLLADSIAYPLPRWTMEGCGHAWTEPGNLVSNGAYELVEWDRGERLVLRKNPFYRRRFPGNVERIDGRIFAEYDPALKAYAQASVDAMTMFNADPGTIGRARASHGSELVSLHRPITFYLLFRNDQPPFDDVRVRQAFAHAVDREALVRDALHGDRLPANGGFVPPGVPAHSSDLGLSCDPDRARRLLAEAGYPGGRGFPTVTWLVPMGSKDEVVVPFLRQAWRRNLGLDLEAGSLEWGPFLERLEKDPAHLTLAGWSADYLDPDNFLRVVFHSTEGLNHARWHNARFDALLDEAARVTDQSRRMDLYVEADRILVAEETAIVPLSYGQGRILMKPWVSLLRVQSVPVRLKNVLVEQGRREGQ